MNVAKMAGMWRWREDRWRQTRSTTCKLCVVRARRSLGGFPAAQKPERGQQHRRTMAAAAAAPLDGSTMPRPHRQPQSTTGVESAATGADQRQPPNQGAADQQEPSFIMKILQHLMLFFLLQNVIGFVKMTFMPSPNNNNNNPNNLHNYVLSPNHPMGKPIGVTTDDNHEWNNRLPKLPPACLWAPGTVMDLSVLITDSPDAPNGWPSLTTTRTTTTTTTTVHDDVDDDTTEDSSLTTSGSILASWQQDGLILGGILPNDDDETSKQANNKPSIISGYLSSNADQTMNHRNATLTIPITQAIWNNETQLYAYVRLQRRRTFRDGTDSRDMDHHPNRLVGKEDVLIKRMTLTRYRKRKKSRDVKSLLDTPSSVDTTVSAGDKDTSVLTVASRNKTHDQILLYMKPFVTLQLIDIASISLPHKKNIPSQIANHMDWYEGGDGDDQGARSFHVPNQDLYYPILYQSEFWMTSGSLKELNGTVKESKLDINVETVPVSPCILHFTALISQSNYALTSRNSNFCSSKRCGNGNYKVKQKTTGVNRKHSPVKKMKGMTCYATCS